MPHVFAALALSLVASPALAQAPDFSGKWTVVAPTRAAGSAQGTAPPTLSAHGDMGSGWGSPLSLAQDARALTVEYSYFHPREMQPPFRLTYLLDGTESRNSVNIGRGPQLQVSRAEWQGDRLVITTRHEFVNPQDGRPMTSETRQTLRLEAADTLVIETLRSGVLGGRAKATLTSYKR
jgi:hypothetical protein